MISKDNKRLLQFFFISLFISMIFILSWIGFYRIPLISYSMTGNITLCILFFPFFFIQLYLSEEEKLKKYRYIPIGLVIFIVWICAMNFMMSSGWDSLGWLILLIGCIAPFVGCICALIYHWFIHRKKNK